MTPKTFTSFADLAAHLDRTQHQADLAAAQRLRRSAPLRKRTPRKPGTGPSIVVPEVAA
jgi:hypothetical protein